MVGAYLIKKEENVSRKKIKLKDKEYNIIEEIKSIEVKVLSNCKEEIRIAKSPT